MCTGYPPPSRGSRAAMDIRIAPKPVAAIQPTSAPLAPAMGISMIRRETILPPRRANRRRKGPAGLGPAPRPLSLLLHEPSTTLPLQPVESLYFELFRSQTANQLSGYFNSNFWTQRVLQECHHEGAIRHSVVALGALYKTLELSFEPPYLTTTQAQQATDIVSHWQVAIKQYSEACNAMLFVRGDSVSSHHTRLMAIILLACFDSFIGDHKQAIIQIQTGLGLLEQFQTRGPPPSPDTGQDDLVTLFHRLAIQAKSYDLAFHFPEPYVVKLDTALMRSDTPSSDRSSPSLVASPHKQDAFQTLAEARLASDHLCMDLLRFTEKLHAANRDPSYVLPSSWKKFGASLKDRLTAWSNAFEPVLASRLFPETPHIERAGIAALKMFQINTNIIFLMMFCDNEYQFDAFMPHFKMIVDLGREVVGAEQSKLAREGSPLGPGHQRYHNVSRAPFVASSQDSARLKPSFAADLGIVPPLYVVATKCRDPWLRRQAIQLLKSSARREGMWDSELTSNIAIWVMQLEEQGVPGGGGPTVPAAFDPHNPQGGYADAKGVMQHTIPDDRRIMVKSVDFDLRARFADMTVGNRSVYRGSVDVRFKKTRITW